MFPVSRTEVGNWGDTGDSTREVGNVGPTGQLGVPDEEVVYYLQISQVPLNSFKWQGSGFGTWWKWGGCRIEWEGEIIYGDIGAV